MYTKQNKKESPISRMVAWRMDQTIILQEKKNSWNAVGDQSGFVYRSGMTPEQARDYVVELNQNKKNSGD